MSVDSDYVILLVKKFGYLEKRVTYLEGKCRGQQGLIEKLQKKVRKFRKENKNSRELVASKVLEGAVDLKPDLNSIQISNENENLKESLERCARNDTKLSQKLAVQMGVRCEENHLHNEMINPNRAIDRKSKIISQSKAKSPQQNAKIVKISSKPKGSHVCSLCSKSFQDISHFSRHMRVHTGERPFKCDICAKTFKSKDNLKTHHRIHTGEKPYSCSVCSRTFSDHSTRRRHMTIHTGEKPYSCSICSRKFSQMSHLNYHRKHAIKCKK